MLVETDEIPELKLLDQATRCLLQLGRLDVACLSLQQQVDEAEQGLEQAARRALDAALLRLPAAMRRDVAPAWEALHAAASHEASLNEAASHEAASHEIGTWDHLHHALLDPDALVTLFQARNALLSDPWVGELLPVLWHLDVADSAVRMLRGAIELVLDLPALMADEQRLQQATVALAELQKVMAADPALLTRVRERLMGGLQQRSARLFREVNAGGAVLPTELVLQRDILRNSHALGQWWLRVQQVLQQDSSSHLGSQSVGTDTDSGHTNAKGESLAVLLMRFDLLPLAASPSSPPSSSGKSIQDAVFVGDSEDVADG